MLLFFLPSRTFLALGWSIIRVLSCCSFLAILTLARSQAYPFEVNLVTVAISYLAAKYFEPVQFTFGSNWCLEPGVFLPFDEADCPCIPIGRCQSLNARLESRLEDVCRQGLACTGQRPLAGPPDAPKGPDVVELVTSIGETIASRLAAQISSSLETLRLDVSSSATKDGAFGSHDRCSPPQANGMPTVVSMGKVDLDRDNLRRLTKRRP
uniref:Uncharacterized protein n=1 Tax=Trichuris muris TaxID=70415 RepID=A0A5S6QW74_TRIMR